MTTALIIIVVIAVIMIKMVTAVVRFCDKNVGFLLVLRWLIGHHHGRTNATFFHAGTKITHPSGRASRWSHKPGYYRMGVRWGVISVIGSSLYGYYTARTLTEIALVLAALALVLFGQWRGVRKVKRHQHNRRVQTPLTQAIASQLAMSPQAAADSVSVRQGYATAKAGETIATVVLPDDYAANPAQQESMEHLLSNRLGMGVDFSWQTRKSPFTVSARVAPALPAMARFSQYVTEIEALSPREYIAGVDHRGNPYIASFSGENPHHGYCWNTGRGKSSTLMSLIAQVFHNDPNATGTVIDPKEVSLAAFQGIPGLKFYNNADDIPGMWQGFTDVYNLMQYRYALLKEDPTIEFPTHLLICEEMNSFAVMSKVYWSRNKEKGDPATPLIWADAIAPIFWRARQARIYIVVVAQSLQERWLGNLNLRPSLGLMSLSGYKPSQWQNIVGTTPIPRAQKGSGRAIFVNGENETWVQGLYETPEYLRDFAMANRINLADTDREPQKLITAKVMPEYIREM